MSLQLAVAVIPSFFSRQTKLFLGFAGLIRLIGALLNSCCGNVVQTG